MSKQPLGRQLSTASNASTTSQTLSSPSSKNSQQQQQKNNISFTDAEGNVQGQEEYDVEAFDLIREKWIRDQLRRRKLEFSHQKTIRAFFGTWNVNAKKPEKEQESLSKWLVHEDLFAPDLYIIGFQEIVDLNAVNLVADHTASKPWEVLIEQIIGPDFVQIRSQHLVGLATVVYLRKSYVDVLRDVNDDNVGVGIMGVGGNKGGVVIRFRIYDSTFCVINSHLAAHKGNVNGRNSDFNNIIKRATFPPIDAIDKTLVDGPMSIQDHEHVFWIGDLNYRLNFDDMQQVFKKIEEKDWKSLLEQDQLILEKKAGNSFQGFEEGDINFGPTYKFTPGTQSYDQVKMRMPAWCDRIQWRKSDDIKQLSYRSADLRCSDHKPVGSMFEVKMKIINDEKQNDVYNNIIKQLDAWENQAIPQVSLSRTTVHFPRVNFGTEYIEKVKMQNACIGMIKFRFVTQHHQDSFSAKWLTVTPSSGLLPPSESIDIEVKVQVGKDAAQPLNLEQEIMQEIIVLSLENGPQYFMTITAEYLKSSFGSTLDFLVRMPEPMRFITPQTQLSNKVQMIPKELWRMVDYLYRNGLESKGIFSNPGDPRQLEHIRECLDTGREFGRVDALAMAEALELFLSSLAHPVFPAELCLQMSESLSLSAWCMQALTKLSILNYHVFIYTLSLLREFLKRKKKNKLRVDVLVFSFSKCLMHWDLTSQIKNVDQDPKRTKQWIVLKHFLISPDFD